MNCLVLSHCPICPPFLKVSLGNTRIIDTLEKHGTNGTMGQSNKWTPIKYFYFPFFIFHFLYPINIYEKDK